MFGCISDAEKKLEDVNENTKEIEKNNESVKRQFEQAEKHPLFKEFSKANDQDTSR